MDSCLLYTSKLFDIPVSGTHAHSWVMSFPDELTAFRAYAEAFPKNCVLLVDTYDVEQGIKNAITVGLEMRERGERLSGIRIDSGDLSWLARMARAMLDEAGLTDCGDVYKRQAKKKGAGLSVSLATWVACPEQKLRDLAEAYAAFRGLKLLGVSFE